MEKITSLIAKKIGIRPKQIASKEEKTMRTDKAVPVTPGARTLLEKKKASLSQEGIRAIEEMNKTPGEVTHYLIPGNKNVIILNKKKEVLGKLYKEDYK